MIASMNAVQPAKLMTKREAIAMEAMKGLLANPHNADLHRLDIAERALKAADALLLAFELTQEP